MTHCTGAPAELWLERYIQGTLPDSESQQFEEHYFDCPVCLAQVEALQAVRARLSQLPAEQLPASQPQAPAVELQAKKRAPLLSWPKVTAAVVGIAASLLIVTMGERFLLPRFLPPNVTLQTGPPTPSKSPAPTNQSPSSVIQLADLTLPPFRAANLRGESENAGFASGMKAYSGGDCRAALNSLSRVPASGSSALAAHFYSGICEIHLGDLIGAAITLQRVAAAGDSPQQEAAFYYLAQIALDRNDAVTARQNLDRTIALHGDFEQRARRQSAALAGGVGKR
jgi:hypothetical protein